MAANDLATALSATTLDEDANPLRALPEGVLGLSAGKAPRPRHRGTERSGQGRHHAANDVPLLCRQIGGARYDGVVRAVGAIEDDVPNKNRQNNRDKERAGEALASLRVAELEKIADGCATATEPRDDDSVRGYWLSKNWAQHLRRYYEQSRAKLLSPSQKGTPIRRRSRSQLARPSPWPGCAMPRFCASTASCALGRVRGRAPTCVGL